MKHFVAREIEQIRVLRRRGLSGSGDRRTPEFGRTTSAPTDKLEDESKFSKSTSAEFLFLCLLAKATPDT